MTLAGEHPEPDVLAAFVDGNLRGEELKSVVDHTRNCDECISVIRITTEFRRESTNVRVAPVRKTMSLAWIAASFILVIAAVALYRNGADSLRSMQAERRLIEGRLTAFDHAPYEPSKRSASADVHRLLKLDELAERAKADRTAVNLHRLALGHLALGQAADARDLLREAIALDPMNSALLSDLAVAQLAMNEPAEAAETSARAIEFDPGLAAARFNWALALERLPVRPSAISAWTEYLAYDATGEWSAEANAHRMRLQQQRPSWEEDKVRIVAGADARAIEAILERHSQQARAWILRELLPQWVREGHKEPLAIALKIGRIRAAAGDRYLLDTVEQASRESSPGLREGIRLFGVASEHLRARQTDLAGGIFADAADLLWKSGSPLAMSAEIAAATTDFYGGRSDSALNRLDRVAGALKAGGNRYPVVMAEEAWIRGLVWFRRDVAASLEAYRRGLTAARRGSDLELEAILTALAAEIVDRIGDPEDADRQRSEALRKLDDVVAAPDRMYTAFFSSAYRSLRARRPRLALAFIDAQQSFAGNNPLMLAESDGARALALRDLGRFREATKFVASGRARVASIATRGLRDRTASNLAFIAGTIESRTNPAAAVESLNRAIAIWSEYGWHVHNAAAYLVRGETHLTLGRRAEAESDFRAGIAEIEQQRDGMSEPRLREAYFERADRLFDRLVEFLIEEKRFDDALTIAERKRARVLLDAVAAHGRGESAEPLSAPDLATAIHASTAVIEYLLLDRGVAMWVVNDGRTFFALREIRRAQLEKAIRDHRLAIDADDAASIDRLGRLLYDHLIAPVSMHLPDGVAVVVVGDGVLQTVPFAALVGSDGRYLIQSRGLAYSPSASVFVRNRDVASRGSGVLVVAQPAPAGMEVLTHAEPEAREVASVWGDVRVLRGAEIAPDEFLARSGRAATVHFAGHATHEEHQPAASALVFESPAGRTPAFLRAADVAATSLPSRPLVILAGCSSGRGLLRQTEGMDSLAAAFLRAGARGVVATLWDIDDEASSRLLLIFHRRLEMGESASEALRYAQLKLIESNSSGRGPRMWAGFVTLGAP